MKDAKHRAERAAVAAAQSGKRNPLYAYLEVALASKLDAAYPSATPNNTAVDISERNLGGMTVIDAIVHRTDTGTKEPFKAGSPKALIELINARYFAQSPEAGLGYMEAMMAAREAVKQAGDITDVVAKTR